MCAASWSALVSPLAPWSAGQRLLYLQEAPGGGQPASEEARAWRLAGLRAALSGAAGAPSASAAGVGGAAAAAKELQRAAARKDTEAVARILDEGHVGVDVEIHDWTEYITVTALFVSAYVGDVRTAELLLDRGADINFVATKSHAFGRPWYASRSHTPVAMAGENGDEDMVRLLLRRGADVDIETVDVEGRWGGSMDGNIWERTKRPSYWCSIKTRQLRDVMEAHSAEGKLKALEKSLLREALEDSEGPVELTPAITRRLMDDIISEGRDQLDAIMERWGFEDQISMEKALRSQVIKDGTGKLQWKFDKCLAVLTRDICPTDLLFEGDFSSGGTGG